MQHVTLGEGATIENAICDKNVVISDGKVLKGAENYPLIVSKNAKI